MPNRKVVAGALGGALATIVVWAASLGGVAVPPEVSAALATILGTLVAYIVPERLVATLVEDDSLLIDEPPAEPTDTRLPIRPEEG